MSPKKSVYILLTVILGILIGFLAYELISAWIVKVQLNRGVMVEYNHIFWLVCSPLSVFAFWKDIILGAVGGFFLGFYWWRLVYVEHRHWRNGIRK